MSDDGLIELHRPTLGVEMDEGWLLPDFDCGHGWQPGCGAPKPEGCELLGDGMSEHARPVSTVVIAGTPMVPKWDYDRIAQQLEGAVEAIQRLNVKWESVRRNCGDPECDGDCRWVRQLERSTGQRLGGSRL